MSDIFHKFKEDITDDEIRIIGSSATLHPKNNRKRIIITIIIAVLLIVSILGIFQFLMPNDSQEIANTSDPEPSYFETIPTPIDSAITYLGTEPNDSVPGYTEIIQTAINDIPLRIYIPHNATAALHVGKMPKDKDIVFIAQAADIRRDNKDIVGAFILKGVPMSWTKSKKGFCAIINDTIIVGHAESTTLFEKAIETNGDFFRQYPLVDNGSIIENEPKNKSIRRALCDRSGEIIIVETLSKESFHDFAQALVDLKVTNAIYLVGSNSYGYAIDKNNEKLKFGVISERMPAKTSYIIWRKQEY